MTNHSLLLIQGQEYRLEQDGDYAVAHTESGSEIRIKGLMSDLIAFLKQRHIDSNVVPWRPSDIS